jgi:aconitate hydratase
MKSIDTFKTCSEIKINGKKYIYFDLNILANFFNFNLLSIPNSIKILLENLIRNEDGETVTHEMISDLCLQIEKKGKKSFEIAFFPTRVLMQDFTGVPAVADLAAMREALYSKNIDPKKLILLLELILLLTIQ